MKKWTIDEIRALVAQAKQGEDKLYFVALEWSTGGDGGTYEVRYFTDKQAMEQYANELMERGGKAYEDADALTIYVQIYAADIKGLTFDVADSFDTMDEEDFFMGELGVMMSDHHDTGGEEVNAYVTEESLDADDTIDHENCEPYNVKGYLRQGDHCRRNEYDVDCLVWQWRGKKFAAYGHMDMTKQVQLDLHYSGETGDLPGIGLDWTAPDGHKHEVFCAYVEMSE